ncbi:MAG: DUF504 domain-containing protein [Pseudomonadota bacterium]
MTPIQDLLNRIRWDKDFGRGEFEIGYYDRVADAIEVVPFREIRFPEDNRGCFELTDQDNRRHSIPFHRVREVYKDRKLIWQRRPSSV